jgi:hypothetical protein
MISFRNTIKDKSSLLLLGLVAILILQCNNKKNQDKFVFHPIEENIPYFNYEHSKITKENNLSKTFDNGLSEINLLTKFLKKTSKQDFQKLNLLVRDPYRFDATSISSNRLVLLDELSNRLIEYDLSSDTTVNLAKKGKGPGDINFPQGIHKDQNNINIPLADMRISQLNCSQRPCLYQRTIELDFRPYSLTKTDSNFAVLGSINVNNSGNNIQFESKLEEIRPIHFLKDNGEEINSFGNAYDVNGHWMLLRPLVNNGKIRYLPSEDTYALIYQRFPFIYIYDSNFKMQKVYEISDFILGKQKYWPETGKVRIVKQNHSLIRNVKVIGGKYVLLEIEEKKDQQTSDFKRTWSRSFDYYLLNISNDKSYYLGSTSPNEKQSIHVLDNGMLINNNGVLHWKSSTP